MKKKKIVKLADSDLNFFKTLLISFFLISLFSILPSSVSFIKKSFKSKEVVFNSSKQNFDAILDKQKKNKILSNSIKDTLSWNIFEDIEVFGKNEENNNPQRLSASTIEELFKENEYNIHAFDIDPKKDYIQKCDYLEFDKHRIRIWDCCKLDPVKIPLIDCEDYE